MSPATLRTSVNKCVPMYLDNYNIQRSLRMRGAQFGFVLFLLGCALKLYISKNYTYLKYTTPTYIEHANVTFNIIIREAVTCL